MNVSNHICSSIEEANILYTMMIEKKAEADDHLRYLFIDWKNLLDSVYRKYYQGWRRSAIDVTREKGKEIEKLVHKIKIRQSQGYGFSLIRSTPHNIKTDFEQLVILWQELMQHLEEIEFFRENA